MRYSDDEQMGIRVLARELDVSNAQIIEGFPQLFDLSIGRFFISYCRSLDRVQLDGAPRAREKNFDAIQNRWITRAESFVSVHQYELVEVIDWLLDAAAHQRPWITNVDDLGRPKKLMKCATMEALSQEADKLMARRPNSGPRRPSREVLLGPEDEVFVRELGAGYTLVRLLSSAALDVEGMRMRHCIGNGGYDWRLEDRHGYSYFSIRDEHGQPRATIETATRLIDEITYGQIRQFQGPRNEPPEAHVVDLVIGAMAEMKWIDQPRSKTSATDDDLRNAFMRGGNLR